MAQKTIVTTHDDLDGREIDNDGGTVSFALEGRQYEIDLHSDNLRGLRDALAAYTAHARPVRGRRPTPAAAGSPTTIDNKAVRAWARDQGLTLSPRGRISAHIVEQYRAATS